MLFLELVAGVIPSLPVFFIAQHFLLKRKPIAYQVEDSTGKKLIRHYQHQQLEVKGKVLPKSIETAKNDSTRKTHNQTLTVAQSNYNKWANNKASVPFVKNAITILQSLAATSTMNLSTEDIHDVEVLSTQTETLLTNWYDTPEQVRNLNQVQEAFDEQLAEINDSSQKLTANGSDNLVRTLRIGTGFIKSKFDNKEL